MRIYFGDKVKYVLISPNGKLHGFSMGLTTCGREILSGVFLPADAVKFWGICYYCWRAGVGSLTDAISSDE